MTLLYRITLRRREGEWKAGYLSHLLSALFFLTYLPEPKVIGLAREASKGKKCFRTIQSAKTSIAIAAEKALNVDFVS